MKIIFAVLSFNRIMHIYKVEVSTKTATAATSLAKTIKLCHIYNNIMTSPTQKLQREETTLRMSPFALAVSKKFAIDFFSLSVSLYVVFAIPCTTQWDIVCRTRNRLLMA